MKTQDCWKLIQSSAERVVGRHTEGPKVHNIPDWVYNELGEKLSEVIGNSNYISNFKLTAEYGRFTYLLTISAIIYWRDFVAPDGGWREIADIVPMWWELHSYEGDEQIERMNDASFDKIKEQIIAL